ncbi:MAG: ROK family protein [Alphaproteobacteria bacterium]|nr:ROK family protein [Alphaproteobacteria bacterium]
MKAELRMGVDIGGTKLEAAVLDASGDIIARRRVATPEDYDAAVAALAALVTGMESEVGTRCSVGLGIPGAISPATGLVKNVYNAPFNGKPLDRDLAQRLHRPLRVMNDANCFALSEATDGSARGQKLVFGVIVGTGCGGGIVLDGKPLVGANAISGEWGHNPLPWAGDDERPGFACACGKLGCIETFLSGTGFAAHHNARYGTGLQAHEIATRAEAGDADAAATLAIYENRMARALAGVINLLDPDAIVLGGGMSNVQSLYRQVPRLWGQWVFSDRVDTKLLPPRFGDSSGVRGAAWLWPIGAET